MSRYYVSIGHGGYVHVPTIMEARKTYKAQGFDYSSSCHAPVNRDWNLDSFAWETNLADAIILEPDANTIGCALCRNTKRSADEKGIPTIEMKGGDSS